MRIAFATWAFIAMLGIASSPARAGAGLELVMLEQAGCAWCARFKAEIAPAYPNTEEGKKAPLRYVDIHAPLPADLANLEIERYTPTFIMLQDGKEIGRMRGYAGDEFFWFLLNEILDKADPRLGG